MIRLPTQSSTSQLYLTIRGARLKGKPFQVWVARAWIIPYLLQRQIPQKEVRHFMQNFTLEAQLFCTPAPCESIPVLTLPVWLRDWISSLKPDAGRDIPRRPIVTPLHDTATPSPSSLHDGDLPSISSTNTAENPGTSPEPANVVEYLTWNFGGEAAALELLLNPCFGTAYQHYSRYLILCRIFSSLGMDFNKPSSQTSISDHPHLVIQHRDVIDWAKLKWGNISNKKRIILQAEQTRSELMNAPTGGLRPRQEEVLHTLQLFAGNFGDSAYFIACKPEERPPVLKWSLPQLVAHIKTGN